MLWNCCIKFFSNNFNMESYTYVDSMHHTMHLDSSNLNTSIKSTPNYESFNKTKTVRKPIIETPPTLFSNRKITSKPLKQKLQSINARDIPIKEETTRNFTVK